MDLWIAIAFIAAIACLAFQAGRQLSPAVCKNRSLLFTLCMLLSLVFAFGLSNRLDWASAFPTPAAICWSNWIPILLAFTAGLASELATLRSWFRLSVTATMLVLSLCFLLLPVTRPVLFPIELADVSNWQDGVCMQTHEASCGPAAAATLLHQSAIQIPITAKAPRAFRAFNRESPSKRQWAEKAMSYFCLTSNQGTTSSGLVRGLRMAVAYSDRTVEVASRDPERWVSQQHLPNVAIVRFTDSENRGPVQRLLGTEGEAHAVVVHSRTENGDWRVADPAVGWRQWEDSEFRRIFTGEAIYLASDRQSNSLP